MEIIEPMLGDDRNEVPIEGRFTGEFRQSLVQCDDNVVAGMVYDGTSFLECIEPPKSATAVLAENTATRNVVLAQACGDCSAARRNRYR
ncbi:hypothetical protein P9239_13330 [Caballeronia sp. LZ062]|uniref:hypothetical protein n=1 Tax=unclassified Caballeronia TaxID=2646786 RepID=UPI002861A2CD|nr:MULTISPECIES: hypothetical protein [unclassified Caballeronia]MDR5854144.1 hypothetical protein [Caballeronia sp. LZ050]MDR5871325.1 hypothetical protein [Caballeronia sp. LZ062]